MLTYKEEVKLIKAEKSRNENLLELQKGFEYANVFINRLYLDKFSNADIKPINKYYLDNIEKTRLFDVTKLVFDPKEDVLDKLVSVYNSLYNLNIPVSIILKGTAEKVHLYFAVRSEELPQLAGNVLESTLRSNFPGISMTSKDFDKTRELFENFHKNDNEKDMLKGLSTVSMVPSLRDKEKGKERFVQGIEKLINTLKGQNYLAFFLSTPVDNITIKNRRHGFEEMYSMLTPHSKLSIAFGENHSHSVNKGITKSFSKSVNESVSNSNSTSSSSTDGTSYGTNSGSNWGGNGDGFSFGSNSGSSNSSSQSYTSGTSFSNSVSKSVGESLVDGENSGESDTDGSSLTKTINYENKGISDMLKKIEQQIARIDIGSSYGLWDNAAYFFSEDISTSILAATTYKSIMIGDESLVEQAHVNIWGGSSIKSENIPVIYDYVKCLKHPKAEVVFTDEYNQQYVTPTSLVSGKELALLLGLPRKSVAGVAIQEMAEFGREVVYENKLPKKSINFGNIYHMGQEEKSTPVNMDLDLFSSHCFITGSSGSGKSYATYNLLDKLIDNGIKMMVIEPAKGEYKQVYGKLDGVNVFTTSTTTYRLLKINPFCFPDKIHVLSHIEQIIQIFSAAWPLYAAMPAILKESIVKAYTKCGWDLQNSIWIEGISDHKYPVFKDVLETLPKIIDSSDYSAESRGNYKGALLTRVQAMTTGINGLIFRDSVGISDNELFDRNTLIDLSEAGSEETIALLMGILIMRLNEYRKSQRKTGVISSHDSPLSHVTVLEEAHNLLKRTSTDQNQEGANLVGKSVQMISNSIKEMRTYGEGFIIIDQSPLAVDSSAVENTATKIIMNTPSKDACDELGSALSLNEEQTKELSRLNVGIAAVLQKGWMSPVLMKVSKRDSSRYEAEIQTENISLMKFVRTQLAKALLLQIRQSNYLPIKLGNIIRESSLLPDRKNELLPIVEMYKKFRLKGKRTISEEKIGELLIEIIGCDSVFEIVDDSKLYDEDQLDQLFEKDREEKIRLEKMQVEYSKQWLRSFENIMDYYVNLSNSERRISLMYMLAAKTRRGLVSSRLTTVYELAKIKHFDVLEEDE